MFSVYVSSDAIGLILERENSIEEYEKQDMIIELIDAAPLSAQIKYDNNDIEVSISIRDSIHSNYQIVHHGRIHGDGITVDEGEVDDILLFAQVAESVNKILYKNSMTNRCKNLDDEVEGVLLEINPQGELTAEIVEGKKRPALLCVSILGETQMMRPYMNEIVKKSVFEMMSVVDLEEMAENGDIDAIEYLADLYIEGNDKVEQNPEKSYHWLIKCADFGNSTAMYNVGLRKAKGYGTDRNLNEAAMWMQKAAEAGDKDGARIAKRYKEISDSENMAKMGDAKAQAVYAKGLMELGGSLYQAGEGSDYEECLIWAQKSVDQGCSDGYWPLALAYHHGRGVEENIEKAIEFYKKGADGGNAACQHSLGCAYMIGEYVKKDAQKAFNLFKSSAEQGYGLAMADLGRCYQFAYGTTGNMIKAIEWYEKSLEVIYDPELERKTQLFKSILEEYPEEGGDFPEYEGDFDFNDPMANVDLSGLFPEDVK